MDHLKLTVDKLSVEVVSDLVLDDSCGAVSLFVGTTRNSFDGKKVLRLEYEAYEPMALKAMKGICDEVRSKWPTVHGIAIYHRLGEVPAREASVVIAVSSPHRQQSLQAVSHCIDALKANVPIWKKEVYEGAEPQWKQNTECPKKQFIKERSPPSIEDSEPEDDSTLVQINVSNEELQKRIQNFIHRKREQINISNVQDFIPGARLSEESQGADEEQTCARVRTQFVKRKDSKGHLKMSKVHNEWGPQISRPAIKEEPSNPHQGLPAAISERVVDVERFLSIKPVNKDVYKRLKVIEDKIAELQAISPEYAVFLKSSNYSDVPSKIAKPIEYQYSAEDIARKIEQLESQGA